ncbi:MAG: CHAT domain-containing protein [Bacteroidota bacterium]|nr:CHAT domain-containing protein [Bacteroidota bacterium]
MPVSEDDGSDSARLRELTDSLSAYLEGREKSADPEILTASMAQIIRGNAVRDTLLLSDALYFAGIHYYQTNRFDRARDCFSVSSSYRESLSLADRRYAKMMFNLVATLHRTGDFDAAYRQGIRALEVRREVVGNDSASLALNYLNLASICLELNDTDRAKAYAEVGLEIARIFQDSVPLKTRGDLYQVIGLSLYRSQEYNKSLVYCREALRIYDRDPASAVESSILLYNTIGQVYRRLNQPKEAEDHFRRGLAFRDGRGTQDKYLLYINYANLLAADGRVSEGESIMNAGLENVRRVYGRESRDYFTMLVSVADFVNSNLGNSGRSLELYGQCFEYVRRNPWDISMAKFLTVKYAGALLDAGRYDEVLSITGGMASKAEAGSSAVDRKSGGNGRTVDPAGTSEDDLNLLEIRYSALNKLAGTEGKTVYLREAVATGRRIASLYDRQRLEMSEDESRTSLSSYSRDLYTGIIDNYAGLYRQDNSPESLEGLFEFAERSKVAGFLASIRELNAARFSLPAELTDLETEIKRETGFYRELIAKEQLRAAPDSQRLATWESVTFRLLRSRDSLNRIFEEQYPSYYNLKYRNEVTSLMDVDRVIGRRTNLLSYILTADKLYIFVVNSRRTEVVVRDIDSTFFSSLQRFREMLSSKPQTTVSRAPFNDYMDLAYNLYRILIEPAEPYLTGDRIVVSPDNILSYIPFETLVTEEFRSPELYYRDAPFALKKYRFSYIYSVTLSSESERVTRRFRNNLMAFAPSYDGMVLDDTLMASWPGMKGGIRDLPNAILEAEDAVRQCGGTAFLGEDALESTFKAEARNYDIIHLSMHTLVDDRQPAFSKMLFSPGDKQGNDGMLNTYEVYSLPLRAMMVVLTSCNTGTGMLVNGEGILSLARGFLYAGSRSAVMSMWEVEDSSSPEVIRGFYKNLRSGQAKSSALRSARIRFLSTADQARSHPYFWSALVIYGDDTPLWFNRVGLYVSLLLLLLVAAALVAMVYRGPRS